MDHENDHRAIARKLDLVHFQEEAPGMVFWHPRGLAMYRVLEEAQRAHVRAEGYEEVRTPQVMRRAIWEASGHWQHFSDGMMRIDGGELESALKPVSCPGHVEIVRRMSPSFRDLPIRLAELGVVHRDEASGALHGLMRLRQFSQDDGHVFCAEAQAEDELVRFLEGVRPFYASFGFRELDIALSLRPDDRAGDDAGWDRAEAILARALERAREPHRVQPGAGAFYGPKIEIALRDRAGRVWQCGTIQMDLVMPVRFDLRYVDAGGDKRGMVMLHRALYGSLERFLGMLLEHHGAALPAWLAPEQIAVLPVSRAQHDVAQERARRLREDGGRVSLD
ncbi:MAG: threonine--tRNA ligase, partial [Myxococcota bacterium]|nr:threonine--tRNA ligase [Myxococcota bacterium]